MQITNTQLKALLDAELSPFTLNFVDVLCTLEVLCRSEEHTSELQSH